MSSFIIDNENNKNLMNIVNEKMDKNGQVIFNQYFQENTKFKIFVDNAKDWKLSTIGTNTDIKNNHQNYGACYCLTGYKSVTKKTQLKLFEKHFGDYVKMRRCNYRKCQKMCAKYVCRWCTEKKDFKVYYCNRKCQKRDWKFHKHNCNC